MAAFTGSPGRSGSDNTEDSPVEWRPAAQGADGGDNAGRRAPRQDNSYVHHPCPARQMYHYFHQLVN